MIEINEESEILVAIAKLETNYKNLDEDMKNVIIKIEDCMIMNAECSRKTFQYMVTTIIGTVAAIFGWTLYFQGAI